MTRHRATRTWQCSSRAAREAIEALEQIGEIGEIGAIATVEGHGSEGRFEAGPIEGRYLYDGERLMVELAAAGEARVATGVADSIWERLDRICGPPVAIG